VKDCPYTTEQVRKMPTCPQCVVGDMKRLPFKGSTMTPNSRDGDEIVVFMDVCGPLPAECRTRHNKFKYFAVFLSRRSRRSWVIFMKSKENFNEVCKQFLEDYHAEFRQYPSMMHFDNDSINVSKVNTSELAARGCRWRTTVPGGEEANAAENLIQQIERGARKLLAQAGLDLSFFCDAVCCFNYLRNRAPKSKNYKNRSPYHIEVGVPPTTAHYMPFGVIMWEHLPYDSRQKLRKNKMMAAAQPVMMVGYAGHRGGDQAYRVYDFKKNRVFVRKHLRPWRDTTAAPIQIGDAAFRQYVKERDVFPRSKIPQGAFGAPPLTPLQAAAHRNKPKPGEQASAPHVDKSTSSSPVGASTASTTTCGTVGATTRKEEVPSLQDGVTPSARAPSIFSSSTPVGEVIWKRFSTGVYKGRAHVT
jgi:hypothetical protein